MRRLTLAVAIATAALAAVAGTSAATVSSGSGVAGVLVKGSGNSFSFWVYSGKPHTTDVQVIFIGGPPVTLTTKPTSVCKPQGPTVVNCSPVSIPVGKPVMEFTFTVKSSLRATTKVETTLSSATTSEASVTSWEDMETHYRRGKPLSTLEQYMAALASRSSQ